MRIGVNCFLLSAPIGGLKQYFHTLFRELLLHDESNEYVFFYFSHNTPELDALGVDRWKHHAVLLNDQGEVRQHLDKIDLYFCPFGAIWPIPLPVPSVVTVVDLQEKYFPEFFTEIDHWNRDYHFYGSTHQADRVITISNFSRDSIHQHHGVPKEKIDVVYLCPQHQFTEALTRPVSPAPSLPETFLFYPANHWKHKNHECLLEALMMLKSDYGVEIPAIFTGFSESNGYPLQDKIRERGLNAIVFEFVSVEEIAFLYKKATLLCFPSLFEGFGIPVVEAMAAGCPVVCSNASSLPEVVGDAAILFDPTVASDCARAVLAVHTDQSLRKQLTMKGLRRAERFTPARMAAEHLATFQRAATEYSRVRFIANRIFFNPLHDLRMLRRKPRPPT